MFYNTKLTILTGLAIMCCCLQMAVAQSNGKKPAPLPPKPVVAVAAPPKDAARTDAFFLQLLSEHPQSFDSIVASRKQRNVQLMYTQVDRGANGVPVLKHFYFNVDSGTYFYPSSAAQLPLAMLTLQAVDELKPTGIDLQTTMLTEKGYGKQTAVYNDPTTRNGKPNIAQYLKKLLITADADAFNRLYEWLGPQYINDQLKRKGYGGAQILNRLELDLTEDENRHTNPIQFYGTDNRLLYDQPGAYFTGKLRQRNDSMGKAFYQNGKLIRKPKSFASMNRVALEDLHSLLIGLVFPSKLSAVQRFPLSDEQRKWLLKYMSQWPTETFNPPYHYDSLQYPQAYNKYLLLGGASDTVAAGLRIFNVTGREYGQLTDVAYIVDFDRQVEFFLSATINCNNTGILREADDDYEGIGLPFMQRLGEVIYQYELKRAKKVLPDLGELRMLYDGR